VVNFDALLEGSMLEHGPEKTHANYEFNQIDLTQSFEVPGDIDAIVHFAAQTHVDRSITDTYSFVSSNILGTYNLLLKTVGKNIRFHLVSTDEVYGDVIGIDKPCDEVSNIHSSSPYSASKAGSEQLVMAWGRTFGIQKNYFLSLFTTLKMILIFLFTAMAQQLDNIFMFLIMSQLFSRF
jgi:dTDP-glucose 4,6-dehydratase